MQMPYVCGSDRLQALVEERDLLLAGLALRVDRDVAHRARAEERDERDQVLELGRLHLAQRLAHPRRLELEDAGRVAAAEHLVGLRVVERQVDEVEVAPDQGDRLVDHVEVPQAEEVHLEQAERLDVLHRELGDELLVGALLLERHVLGQRAVADDDAGRVDRVLADEPLERAREVDDLAHDLVLVVGLPELLPRASGSRRGRPSGPPGSASRPCRRRRRGCRARGRRRGRRPGPPSSRR